MPYLGNTINSTYAQLMMGRLGVIPSIYYDLPVFRLAVTSLAWYGKVMQHFLVLYKARVFSLLLRYFLARLLGHESKSSISICACVGDFSGTLALSLRQFYLNSSPSYFTYIYYAEKQKRYG